MTATIKDIAAACGVSFQTVSHVLKGNYRKVSPDKKAKIAEMVRKLDYRPNIAAKGLKKQQSFLVGVLFPSTNNRLYSEMLISIQQYLFSRGYAGIYAFWKNLDEVRTAYEMVLKRNVDGILTAHNEPSLFPEEIPLINYGHKFDGFDCVRMDKTDIAEKTASYLAGLGHRKIGFINIKDLPLEYFKGFELRPEWCSETGDDYSGGYHGMLRIISAAERPSAIVTHNDISAIGAMTAAREHHLRIPEDISIIGRDNIEEGQYASTPLTTFGPDEKADRCALLVDTLFERMESPSLPERDIAIKGKLIIRASCAKFSKESGR